MASSRLMIVAAEAYAIRSVASLFIFRFNILSVRLCYKYFGKLPDLATFV